VLVEAEAAIGGGWHAAHGTETPDTVQLAAAAVAAGVDILTGVTATGWYDGMVAAITPDTHLEIRAGAVVSAMGSYDRVPLVPGADRPGVMAARTVCGLIERHGILPGESAVLVGAGQELATAAELLARAGAELLGPVPTTSLAAIRGRTRVTGVVTLDGGRSRRHRADLVVFGDRSPNLDLVLSAGGAVERHDRTLVPVTDGTGRTTIPGLFVVGSTAGRPVLGPVEADDARMAGRAAAAPRGVPSPAPTLVRHTAHGPIDAVAAADGIVCFCEDVRVWEVRDELAAGYTDPELVKRRTGALTGPCQGKSCLQAFDCVAGGGAIPTARPPLRPVRLGDLVAAETGADPDPVTAAR
jgi:thioredoxin reductase